MEFLALHYTLPLKLEIVARPRRKSQASSLGNLNGGETPSLGCDLCGSDQEAVISMNLLNDPSSEQESCSPKIEEIDGAFRAVKEPAVALILPPSSPGTAVGNGL